MKRNSLFLLLLISISISCQTVPVIQPTQIPTPSKTPQTTPLLKTNQDMVVGFVEHWGEGGWYTDNRNSFKHVAIELGITLKYNEIANPDPSGNQERGFRDFIADPEINVIVIAAHKRTGWDEILREAQTGGKVIIFEGWTVDASEDLYATYIGSNYAGQGRKAGQAMVELLEDSEKKNIVELVGASDSPVAKDRGKGFRESIQSSGVEITQSQIANWRVDDGRQVMETLLGENKDIQGVFAQNDEMALGAIAAIKEAGLKPGIDIKIVSIDGSTGALKAMAAGDLNATVEDNPWLAPQVYEAALKALNGETLPKRIASKEDVYVTPLQAQEELQRRQAEGATW